MSNKTLRYVKAAVIDYTDCTKSFSHDSGYDGKLAVFTNRKDLFRYARCVAFECLAFGSHHHLAVVAEHGLVKVSEMRWGDPSSTGRKPQNDEICRVTADYTDSDGVEHRIQVVSYEEKVIIR